MPQSVTGGRLDSFEREAAAAFIAGRRASPMTHRGTSRRGHSLNS